MKLGIIATQTADGIDAGPAFSFDDVLVASAVPRGTSPRGAELARAPLAFGRPVAKVTRARAFSTPFTYVPRPKTCVLCASTHTPHQQPVANLASQSRHRTPAVHLRSISQLSRPIPTPSIHHIIFSQSQAVFAAGHHGLQVPSHSHRGHRSAPFIHASVTQLA